MAVVFENVPASSKAWIAVKSLAFPKFMPPFEKSIGKPKPWPGPNDWPAWYNISWDEKFCGIT